MNKLIPIVVVAYNRLHSLKRLLESLNRATYPDQDIPLIISIDHGDNEEIRQLADSYEWIYGSKEVKYQTVNLGLREHILRCGDLSQQYDALIVLEDDLYVAPDFYNYVLQAVHFCSEEDGIAGISLYNHKFNQHTRENFSALEDGYENWYFQYASSWGQVWTAKQWANFRKWYDANHTHYSFEDLPYNIRSWSEKSWLKYHIAYVVESDKYFLYPRVSMSTNFNDTGTHITRKSTVYQVPLSMGKSESYNFSTIRNSRALYDVYFENRQLGDFLNISNSDLCTDLYGEKSEPDKRYWLSSQASNYRILKSFGLEFRPHELNIILDLPGHHFYLYDTDYTEPFTHKKPDSIERLLYTYKEVHYFQALKLFISGLKARILHNLKKFS